MARRKPIARKTPERIQRAQFLRAQRKSERESFTFISMMPHPFQTAGGIATASKRYKIDLAATARAMFQQEKRPLSFLDLGAGQGITGLELQEAIGRSNLNAYAISLSRPFNRKGIIGRQLRAKFPDASSRFAAFRVGEYERKERAFFGKRKFDIIFSTIVSLRTHDVVRIASRLRPRGLALCALEVNNAWDFAQVKAALKHNGFDARLQDTTTRPYPDGSENIILFLHIQHLAH